MTEAEYIQSTKPFAGTLGTDKCYIDFDVSFPGSEISPQDTLTDAFDILIIRTSILIDKIT